MPATLLPLALLLLSAAALVLKVACHHVYTQVQAPARRASSPGGPRLPSILKMGNRGVQQLPLLTAEVQARDRTQPRFGI